MIFIQEKNFRVACYDVCFNFAVTKNEAPLLSDLFWKNKKRPRGEFSSISMRSITYSLWSMMHLSEKNTFLNLERMVKCLKCKFNDILRKFSKLEIWNVPLCATFKRSLCLHFFITDGSTGRNNGDWCWQNGERDHNWSCILITIQKWVMLELEKWMKWMLKRMMTTLKT